MAKKSIKENFNTRTQRQIDEAFERLDAAVRLLDDHPEDNDAFDAYRKAHKALETAREQRDNPPWQPLILALAGGHLEEVIKLTDNGKAIKELNEEGISLLMIPAANGDEEIVDYLLSKGANPNLGSTDRVTALSIAAMKDEAEIFKKLLKAGADVNIRTRQGDTIAQLAGYNDSEEVLKVLNDKKLMARLTGKPQPKSPKL